MQQDTRYKIQDTRYKIQDMLKHVLIIGFITTLLCTTVTCGSEGNAGTVDITQADVDRLQSNWQQTLDDLNDGDGVLLPNNTYTFELFLNELYRGTITSTENLTISLTSSTNGITISPSNATLPFNEALDASWPQMLTIDETVAGCQRYSIIVSLSSQALDETFTFDLYFFIIETTEKLEITQIDVDNFGNMVKDLLATASGNFIQAGNSFTLTLFLCSLYRGEPLTMTFTSSHTDVTVSPISYETSSVADLNFEWTITYSEESSSDMTYNIDISIMSESLSSTLSTTLDLPSPIDAIFDLGVGISPSLSLTGTEHVPVLVLSNLPRRSDFTYTLEQADDATFSSVTTTTTFAYSDIGETTFEYVLDKSLTSSDWGSTLTDHQFYRLSVYDSNNRFLTGGNTSDITEIVYSTFVGNVSAVGDGSEATPYQISNVYQLQEMGTVPNLDKYFVLVGNINATETDSWANGAGFNPIDACMDTSCNDVTDITDFFKGSLDGRGYTISNLYINSPPGSRNVGLFGAVGGTSSQTATIENITLSAINIITNDTARRVGSFVAYMRNYTELQNLNVDSSSTLSFSYSSSSPLRFNLLYLGGLVGYMNGGGASLSSSVSYSILSVSVNINGSTALYTGGLVGTMDEGSSLSSSVSYSILSVFFFSTSISILGGLVGYMNEDASLSSSISYSIISSSSSIDTGNSGGDAIFSLGGLVGYMNEDASLSSSISYSIISYFANVANLYSGGLMGRITKASLSSSVSYSILSASATGNLYSGGLVGRMEVGSLSSSIGYSILSSSASIVSDVYLGGLVGSGTNIHSSLGSAQLWFVRALGTTTEFNLGSLLGSNLGTINNSYIDTSFLMLNENNTFGINPSVSDFPLIDDNRSTANCIEAFSYSETLSATDGSDCSDTDLFYNFATYDSDDEGTEPDWSVSDSTFYPRPATMPSVFNISKLATQDEYRMMASHSLVRFYDGAPKDESGSDDIVDNASNVLFITHKSRGITSVDDLEEAYYEVVLSNNLYISQGLDATLLTDDNTLYTNSDTGSTKFTYSFGLAQDRRSTSSSSLTVNGVTLSLNQDTTGTYISGVDSLSVDDDFYIEVTVNSSASVTLSENDTSFSRRYRFKKGSVVVDSSIYIEQIRFESQSNPSNVVTYDNDTEATSIMITENPKEDSNVTFIFSEPVTGLAGFSITFSNTLTCSGGYSGDTVIGFTNTDTVLIDATRINYCGIYDEDVAGMPILTQMITIPAGAFVSQDGSPLPMITIGFTPDAVVSLEQIRFESRGNSSNVVTYENDTRATSIMITENPKEDSNVTFIFSESVTGQAGFSITFSNPVLCNSATYSGDTVSGFTNTDTVLIDATRINSCSIYQADTDVILTQMITIPAGAFQSSDGTPLPEVTIEFTPDAVVSLEQIRFESRGNSSNVVTYDNDTRATSIMITENPKEDSNVTFIFSESVTGQAGFSITFSNPVLCNSATYSGDTVIGFTNTDTVLIDATRINSCSIYQADAGGIPTDVILTQMITIPAGAFQSSDGTPLPEVTIEFTPEEL